MRFLKSYFRHLGKLGTYQPCIADPEGHMNQLYSPLKWYQLYRTEKENRTNNARFRKEVLTPMFVSMQLEDVSYAYGKAILNLYE